MRGGGSDLASKNENPASPAIVIAAVATATILLFSAIMVSWIAELREASARQALATTSRVLSLTFDRQIETWMAALAAMATSPAFDGGDVSTLYRQAKETADRYGAWLAISKPSGQQIVNTLVPPGVALPKSEPSTIVAGLSPDGMVHDLFEGPAARRAITGVTFPVMRNGAVTHYLHLGAAPERLSVVLAGQNFPAGWSIVLFDGNNRILTRLPDLPGLVGKPAMDWYINGTADADHGFLSAELHDGTDVLVAFERLSKAPWSVAVAMPLSEITQTWLQPLALLSAGGLALMALTSFAFVIVAARVTIPLDGLARAAEMIGKGESVPPLPVSQIREIDALRKAICQLFEKQLLLREAHHRIKNSLQIVASSLHVYSRGTQGHARAAFEQASARIMAIARLHDRLCKSDGSRVDFSALTRELCEDLSRIACEKASLRYSGRGAAAMPSSAAASYAFIVAELVTNALKHAERADDGAVVTVSSNVEPGPVVSLTVCDNGPGLPPGFEIGAQKGVGLKMCAALASQIGGTLRDVPGPSGACFELRIPVSPPTVPE